MTTVRMWIKISVSLVLLFKFASSQDQITPLFYDIYNVVPYNGSYLTANSSGCHRSNPQLISCEFDGVLEAKLTDGKGTQLTKSLDLNNYLAFSRYSEGSIGRVTASFMQPVSVVIIYFYNSPMDYIGLPCITTFKASAMPLSCYFSGNNDLTQTDSQLRTVTLNLSQEETLIQLDFTFSNSSRIDWFLVSEIQYYNGTPISPPIEDIKFKDGNYSVVTLGPDNIQSSIGLNCTVINNGSFEWEWEYNNSNTDAKMWISDATRTTVLSISNLSFVKEGNYTCTVYRQSNSLKYQRNIHLQLAVKLRKISIIQANHLIVLTCEMSGYLRPEIIWMKDSIAITNGTQYSISVSNGNETSVSTGGQTTRSIISTLTINDPLLTENNTEYTCAIPGTGLKVIIPIKLHFSDTKSGDTSIGIQASFIVTSENPFSTSIFLTPSTKLPASSHQMSPILVTILIILAFVTFIVLVVASFCLTAVLHIRKRDEGISPSEEPHSIMLTSNTAYLTVLSVVESETIYDEIKNVDENSDDDDDDGYI